MLRVSTTGKNEICQTVELLTKLVDTDWNLR